MHSGACRALVSLADATAAVVQQGVRVWARPEALAGVLRARFEELPATAAAAAGGAGAGGAGRPRLTLRARLDFQLLSFKVGQPSYGPAIIYDQQPGTEAANTHNGRQMLPCNLQTFLRY